MGVTLRDCATSSIWNILAKDNVVKGEAGGRTVGKVRNGHCSGSSTVFVEKDHVSESRGGCAGDEISKNESSTVETDGGREKKTNFFGECTETCRWRARGGDQRARVNNAGGQNVFIVDVHLRVLLVLRFVIFEVFPKRLIVRNSGVQGLSRSQRGLELCSLLGNGGIAKQQSSPIEIIATLAGLAALFKVSKISELFGLYSTHQHFEGENVNRLDQRSV